MNLRTLALMTALAVLGCRERATPPSGSAAGSSTPAPVASAPANPAPAATSTTLDTPAYREWARQMGSAPSTTPVPATPAPAVADDHGHSHEADGAARIGAAELKAKLDAGDAIVVDVRSREQWEWSRVPGALHIAYPDLFARSVELPQEKLIALYCT